MKIGKAMQTIREERGLTRKELAGRLGCTVSCLCKIENGKVWPKKETVEKFCRNAHIPLAYLYQQSFTIEDYEWPLEMDFDVVDTGEAILTKALGYE